MLFAFFFFAHLNKTKGKERKQNKNERKTEKTLATFFEGGFSFCMVHDFELYLLPQYRPCCLSRSHLHADFFLALHYLEIYAVGGSPCDSFPFRPSIFWRSPGEGRGVGRVGESAEPTSDFLCRLAHYVELVFVWPLIEMAKLVGFYWLTPALFHNPKKYAMAFLGTHWLDSLIISNMKTAFVW